MPELPEVEIVRCGLANLIVGRVVRSAVAIDSPKSFPNAPDDVKNFLALTPQYYSWKNDGSQTKRMGLIAQDVQQVLPEFVIEGSDGYLQLDYGGLVAPLIGAVKEQQAQINALSRRVNNLQNANWQSGGTINGNLTIGGNINVMGSASVVNLTVARNLAVKGNTIVMGRLDTGSVVVAGHITTKGSKPLVSTGIALGTVTGDSLAVTGTDGAGQIVATSGSDATSGLIATVKFAKAYDTDFKVVVSASNENAATIRIFTVKTQEGFEIHTLDELQSGLEYKFDYISQGSISE